MAPRRPGQPHPFPLPPDQIYRGGGKPPSHPSKRARILDLITYDIPLPKSVRRVPTSAPSEWQEALSHALTYRFPDPKEDLDMNLALWETIPDTDAELASHPHASEIALALYTEDTPWNKMEEEPFDKYEGFLYYRDQGMAERNYSRVAEKMDVTIATVSSWAKKYNWHQRVVAWDEYRERIYTATVIEKTKEMAETHAEVAASGIRALSTAFTAIIERMERDPEGFMSELNDKTAAQLLAIAKSSAQVLPNLMSAERLSRGLPTELSASVVAVNQQVTIHSRDDLAALVLGIADVLGHDPQEDVIDVRAGSSDAGEEADPADE